MTFKRYLGESYIQPVSWYSTVQSITSSGPTVVVVANNDSPGAKKINTERGGGGMTHSFTVRMDHTWANKVTESMLSGTLNFSKYKIVTDHGQFQAYVIKDNLYFEGITDSNWVESFYMPKTQWLGATHT